MKILIVEDEIELAHSIINYLQNQDYTCDLASDLEEAELKLSLCNYDCVILDIMLPYGNGVDLLQSLKKAGKENAVIIISAKNSLDDKVKSLSLGANDYLAKPFHLAELNARLQSMVSEQNFSELNNITYKNLDINLSTRGVKVAGKEVDITSTEFSLLLFLLRNKNKVVSKNAIAENLSGQSALYFDNFDIIHSHILRLKKKLGVAGDYIKTIYDTGYNLN